MVKALFDTNVVLDALAERKGFSEDARTLFRLVAADRMTGYICGSSVTDIYYIIRKEVGLEKARYTIGVILEFFTIVNVGEAVCSTAFEMGWADFEDAVVAACGVDAGVDVLITRDHGLLRHEADFPFTIVTPHDAVSKYG